MYFNRCFLWGYFDCYLHLCLIWKPFWIWENECSDQTLYQMAIKELSASVPKLCFCLALSASYSCCQMSSWSQYNKQNKPLIKWKLQIRFQLHVDNEKYALNSYYLLFEYSWSFGLIEFVNKVERKRSLFTRSLKKWPTFHPLLYSFLLTYYTGIIPCLTFCHWTRVSVIKFMLGPCQFFFQSLVYGLNHYYLSAVYPNFCDKMIWTNVA